MKIAMSRWRNNKWLSGLFVYCDVPAIQLRRIRLDKRLELYPHKVQLVLLDRMYMLRKIIQSMLS